MSLKFFPGFVVSLTVLSSSPAWGQIKRFQPWHPYDGPVFETRVQNCANPAGFPPILNRIALDDFQCEQTGPITWVKWSGDLPNGPAQRFKRFYIRIWSHTASPCTPCGNPGAPLASAWCVYPHSQKIGHNCVPPFPPGQQVWGFWTTLSPPFIQTAGQHYWLQISEIEDESITLDPGPAGIDFRWSTYHPTSIFPLCPAMYFPIPSTCDLGAICDPHLNPPGYANGPDLAFRLGTTLVAGAVLAPTLPLPPPTAFVAEFRTSAGGEVVYTETLEPAEDGAYAIDPELPDGTYQMTLRGMGMGAQTRSITVSGGVAMGADFAIAKLGDLNNDGIVDGMDIPIIVSGLLAP